MSYDKVRGEHFLEVAPQTTTRACLERMRDEGSPVALVVDAGRVTGLVDAAIVQALVLGQPASWDQPIGAIARSPVMLAADSTPEQVETALKAGMVILAGKSTKVISRSGWLSYLNLTRNTAVFNPVPSSEGV
jgi:CBS domain-containing protein